MALDKFQLRERLTEIFHHGGGGSEREAHQVAQDIVDDLADRHPEWFPLPKISLTSFLSARAHSYGIEGTPFGKAIEAQVKRYVDWAQGNPQNGQPHHLGTGLKEALKTLAESWKTHPDYERIDWP